MHKQLIATADGSHTVLIPQLNVSYHSVHGAIQESQHVFIEAGLNFLLNSQTKQLDDATTKHLNVFEPGFGTGLNAFLTAIEADIKKFPLSYTALEPYPLTVEEAKKLNYPEKLGFGQWFELLHQSAWNETVRIHEFFELKKLNLGIEAFTSVKAGISTDEKFHLVYFDAFAPAAQPELWTEEVFRKIFNLMQPGGILVTYCSKGVVRRAMTAAGFAVTKLPGPPGKREMVRAVKPEGK